MIGIPNRYDMELLNRRYGDSAMVLPHRQYGLLSGEFRKKDLDLTILGECSSVGQGKVFPEGGLNDD
jgi:hypothetical protein